MSNSSAQTAAVRCILSSIIAVDECEGPKLYPACFDHNERVPEHIENSVDSIFNTTFSGGRECDSL